MLANRFAKVFPEHEAVVFILVKKSEL